MGCVGESSALSGFFLFLSGFAESGKDGVSSSTISRRDEEDRDVGAPLGLITVGWAALLLLEEVSMEDWVSRSVSSRTKGGRLPVSLGDAASVSISSSEEMS